MNIIRDFRCAYGHVSEKYISNKVIITDCAKCGAEAIKMISPVRSILDHTFPGQADKWAREHERHGDIAKAKRGEPLG